MMNETTIVRKTAETDITLTLARGTGKAQINTGCGFLDHMLTLFTRHGGFDLTLTCKGDLQVDAHHTAEDIGICLGRAVGELAGDKKGLSRYGFMILPMDETLILSSVDISGRAQLCYGLDIPTQKVGEFDTELTEEFMLAFVRNANLTLHLKQLDGKNSHHIIEGTFKSLARSLKQAVKIDKEAENEIPSTKGVL